MKSATSGFGKHWSPVDWKYLWLNESFATYFGYGVVSPLYRRLGHLASSFCKGTTATAMNAGPCWKTSRSKIPGGEQPRDQQRAPRRLSTTRAGKILRQVEAYIGRRKNFQKGCSTICGRQRLPKSAEAPPLEAFEAVSTGRSPTWSKNWVSSRGFPVISAAPRATRWCCPVAFTLSSQRLRPDMADPRQPGVFTSRGSAAHHGVDGNR